VVVVLVGSFLAAAVQWRMELELELIQTRMTQEQLLWVEVGKSACVLVSACSI
jgi:hypothetical protein